MSWFDALRYRVRTRWRPAIRERELDAEFAFHLEMEMRANLDRGMSPDDARSNAHRDFGHPGVVRDRLRDARGRSAFDMLGDDVRTAARKLWRDRRFTAAIVLILALGLGWTTAIISVVDTALVRPLPYAAPDRLVHLWGTQDGTTMTRGEASVPELLDWREQRSLFADVAAYRQTGFTIVTREQGQRARGVRVTANLLRVLGAQPLLGRDFGDDDDKPGAPLTALVSHEFWQTHLGGDPAVIGRSLSINGEQATLVGVLAPRFQFVLASTTEVWTPLRLNPGTDPRDRRWLRVIARLRPGTPVPGANAEFDALMRRMAAEHPATSAGRGGTLVPIRDEVVGTNRLLLVTLFLGAAVLLLTGCANVAGLLLARAAGRAPEMAVRRALGAERGRIVVQLLVEHLLLVGVGGMVGVGVAFVALEVLIAQIPAPILALMPFLVATSLDARAVALGGLLSVVTGLACGLGPALAASRRAPSEILRRGGRTVTGRQSWRLALVSGQVALTFVLVASSALLGRSLYRLLRVDPGFAADGLVTFGISLVGARYQDAAARGAMYDDLSLRIANLPRVTAVTVGSELPLEYGETQPFVLDGLTPLSGSQPHVRVRFVAPSYFAVLGMRLGVGRPLGWADTIDVGGVVVNEAFVREFAAGTSVLERRLALGGPPQRSIVGTVSDVPMSIDRAAAPTVYVAVSPAGRTFHRFAVRHRGPPAPVWTGIRNAVAAVDAELPVLTPRTMREAIESSSAVFFRRFPMVCIAVFSAVGMTLAIVGVVGIVSHGVVRRTREFGIRQALGATPGEVLRLAMRDGMRAVGIGIGVGLVLTALGTRSLWALLYGVSPLDLVSYVGTCLLLAGAAGVASLVPARRVNTISPASAMRADM